MGLFGELRAIEDDELELMLSWRNRPSVRMNMYTTHEIALDDHRQWWKGVQTNPKQQFFMYASDARPLGIVAFTEINTQSHHASWAFYAAPDAPRGTGSKMEFLALDYAFEQLKLHKLHCEVLAFNVPVLKLHQKFGFTVEGIFREQHKTATGFVDIHRLGLLAREWAEHRQQMQTKLAKLQKANT